MSFLSENNAVPGCYVIHVGTELADSDSIVKENLKSYLKERLHAKSFDLTDKLLISYLDDEIKQKIDIHNMKT